MAAATATASTIRYAPEDPNLPKPWKGLVDSRTGYLYFWNPETNVTQYERPPGLAPPKPSPAPISSSVQAQQQPSSGFSSGKEEDKYDNDGPKTDSGSRFSEVLISACHIVFISLLDILCIKIFFNFGTGKQKWTYEFK